MHLGDASQSVASSTIRDLFCGLLDGRGDAAGKWKPEAFAGGLQPIDKFLASKDRGGGDGVIRFSLRPLVEEIFDPFPSEPVGERERRRTYPRARARIRAATRRGFQ